MLYVNNFRKYYNANNYKKKLELPKPVDLNDLYIKHVNSMLKSEAPVTIEERIKFAMTMDHIIQEHKR